VRHPFSTFVAIRVAFWLGTAATLLWAPVRGAEIAPDRAWGPLSDLFFGTFDHWDAQWFIHIALDGYTATSAAFFPLYPLLLYLVGSSLVLGTLLSLVAAGLGAWAVASIAQPIVGGEGARDSVLILALFPTAFVFTSLYSDGVFLLASAVSFLAAQRGRPWIAGIAGGLAVASRVLGLALLPALVYLLWPRRRRDAWRLAPLVLLPAAVGAYAFYLRWKLDDPWAFRHAQGQWNRSAATLGPAGGLWDAIRAGWHSSLEILRHLPRNQGGPAGYVTTDQVALWNVVQLLVLVVAVWLTWVAWRRLGPAFGLYSVTTLVLVLSFPANYSPLVSLPRFVMADFPLLIALAAVVQGRPGLRTGVLVTLGALSGAAGVAFARGVWIA
jgi:hypothetical protein